ncbi:MAG: hypothetical protein WA948_11820 [Pontixanthobacter sp.]
MSLISRLNPKEGITDFWSEFTRPNPYRWPILAVSIGITTGLMIWITQDNVVGEPVPYEVEYITTFQEGRSEDAILAENEANQRRKDELERILAAREERKKELYRALGRAAGMDVDKIEREAAQDAARVQEEAARERRVLSEGRGTSAAQ